jgi:hypothetical protein
MDNKTLLLKLRESAKSKRIKYILKCCHQDNPFSDLGDFIQEEVEADEAKDILIKMLEIGIVKENTVAAFIDYWDSKYYENFFTDEDGHVLATDDGHSLVEDSEDDDDSADYHYG